MSSKMMDDNIVIAPCRTFPFRNPEDDQSYYCNAYCKRYTSDFSAAAIRTGYRRCRPCQQQINATRKKKLTKIGILKKRLYYAFIYHKRPDISKALTDAHIIRILQAGGINREDIYIYIWCIEAIESLKVVAHRCVVMQ